MCGILTVGIAWFAMLIVATNDPLLSLGLATATMLVFWAASTNEKEP